MAEQGRTDREAWEAEQFRLLVENVKDYAIFIVDSQGRVLSWSKGAERLLGYREDDIIGQSSDLFFTPEDRQAGVPQKELEQALVTGRGEDDRWHVRKDGSRFWASGAVTPLREAGGKLRGFAKIMRDRTDLKQAQEALADASRRKDAFLAMLSHELRNPLAPILNSLHIMRQVVSESPVLQQVRATIERQVGQMARLVDDLLDVTRISKGKLELRKERIELRPVVERAVEAVRPLIEMHRHELTVSLPSAPVWLEADPARLGQVVTNLLNNAAKYTEAGGRITLGASLQPDAVVLRVRDNGVGIAPDMLPRVFDLFAQADVSQARSQGGLGVGLTLVKQLVEMHGGTVEAASAGLGRGSEFTVRLPVLASVGGEGPRGVETTRHDARPLHVLAVDDNVDAADSLAMLLRLGGHEVQVVHNGLKALELAEAYRPDVVLLDLGLPGLDGFQVAERLRRLPGGDTVVLVALTGYGQEADRQRSQAAGFRHHLVKPVDPEGLQRLLASFRPGEPEKGPR